MKRPREGRHTILTGMFEGLRSLAHPVGTGWRAALPPQRNLKNTDFVDTISRALRHLRFTLNQPLKSADDWYNRKLKIIIKIYEYVYFSFFN
jgi:hypothetical protein